MGNDSAEDKEPTFSNALGASRQALRKSKPSLVLTQRCSKRRKLDIAFFDISSAEDGVFSVITLGFAKTPGEKKILQ